MSVLAAIAVFPVLTLLLIGLAKAENTLFGAASFADRNRPADTQPLSEIPID